MPPVTCSTRTISLIAATLVLSSGYFAASTRPDLPDYESYELIYSMGASNFAESRTELLFVGLVEACRSYSLTYEQFRAVVLALSVGMLLSALALLRRTAVHSAIRSGRRKLHPLDVAIASFATYGFALEFLEIRIRSGVAISAALLSFAFYLHAKWRSRLSLLPAGVFAAIALGLHAWTAAMLLYVMYSTASVGVMYERLSRRLPGRIVMALALLLATGVFLFLVYFAADQSESLRGEHLLSDLNPARFLFLGLVPLAFGVASARHFLRGYVPGTTGGRLAFALARLHYFSFANVIGFAVAVSLFYLSGTLGGSGEALVRLHGAFVPALLFGLPLYATKLTHLHRFVVVGNALFFLNALHWTVW